MDTCTAVFKIMLLVQSGNHRLSLSVNISLQKCVIFLAFLKDKCSRYIVWEKVIIINKQNLWILHFHCSCYYVFWWISSLPYIKCFVSSKTTVIGTSSHLIKSSNVMCHHFRFSRLSKNVMLSLSPNYYHSLCVNRYQYLL